MAIITVQNLKKRYGDIEALKNISLPWTAPGSSSVALKPTKRSTA
jgi:ABC-type multidrug transport system ATPase subunit